MTFDRDNLLSDEDDDPKLVRQLSRVREFLSRHCKQRAVFAEGLSSALDSFASSLKLERLDASHGGGCRHVIWCPVAHSSPTLAHTIPGTDVEAIRWSGFSGDPEFVRLVKHFEGDVTKTLSVAACMLIERDHACGDVESLRIGLDLFDDLSEQRRSTSGTLAHRQAISRLERYRARAIKLWDVSKLPERERIASIIEGLGAHPTTGQAFNRSTVDRWLRNAGRRSSAS